MKTLRTVSASVLLTMRLFDTLPAPDLRPKSAIVRQMPPIGRFDPREQLPSGIVLTMPFTLDSAEIRPHRFGEFWMN